MMSTLTHPSKQQVREYLQRRTRAATPPPAPEEVRRQLGWNLLAPGFKPNLGRS
jgi:hypothetical protein